LSLYPDEEKIYKKRERMVPSAFLGGGEKIYFQPRSAWQEEMGRGHTYHEREIYEIIKNGRSGEL